MKTVLLLVSSFIFSCSFCQDSTSVRSRFQFQTLFQYDFPESYGITAGAVFQLTPAEHKKNYRNSSDYYLWIASMEVGWLHYPLNSSAFNFNAGIGLRRSKFPGHYHEWLLEEGVFRTFYQGTVYTISSDGNVKELSNYGRTYATTAFSYLQNWDINFSNQPISFLIKPSFWIQYPFNGFIKPHSSLKIGARFYFNHKKSFSHAL